ncbi:MAG: hypothetical protein AAGC84_04875 [Pseudomonas sp.]
MLAKAANIELRQQAGSYKILPIIGFQPREFGLHLFQKRAKTIHFVALKTRLLLLRTAQVQKGNVATSHAIRDFCDFRTNWLRLVAPLTSNGFNPR